MPVISAIVPVYNSEKYLDKCLSSLKNQSLEDIEVICVDDGSIDSSLDVINRYVSEDSRFKLIKSGHFGAGDARNKGLASAMGEYIVFVDSDDWLREDALSKIYNTFREYPVEVVQFDYVVQNDFFDNSRIKSLVKPFKKKYNYNFIKNPIFSWLDVKGASLKDITLYSWNKAYKKELLDGNNITFAPSKCSCEHIFVQKATILASKIFYLNYPLYYHRIRENSSTMLKSDDNFDIFENIKLTYSFLEEKRLLKDLEEEFSQYKIVALAWHYGMILPQSQEKYVFEASKILSNKEYRDFMKLISKSKTFFENIFSLKNRTEDGSKHKILTVMGMQFKLN